MMFFRAIGHYALADPSDEILIHDVAGNPAAVEVVPHGTVLRRHALLNIRFALFGHPREGPGDAQRVSVVDRYAPLEVIAGEQRVGPQAHAAGGPHGIRFAHAFAQPAVDEAIVELFEFNPQVAGRIGPEFIPQAHAPVHVHPLEMQRVDGIFLTLKPVARNFGEHDLDKAVLPGEWFPIGHQRRRLRAEIRPDQARLDLDWIRRDADLVLELRLRRRDVFVWLLRTAAGLIEEPAVIIATQPALLDEAVRQVGPAMRAMPVHQAECAAQVLVEGEVFAHDTNRLDRFVLELADRGDGHPVPAEQVAHGGSGSYLRQQAIFRFIEHSTAQYRPDWLRTESDGAWYVAYAEWLSCGPRLLFQKCYMLASIALVGRAPLEGVRICSR